MRRRDNRRHAGILPMLMVAGALARMPSLRCTTLAPRPMRCCLADPPAAIVVPDPSKPCVLLEDDQIAIVAKPAGIPVSASGGSRPSRNGPALLCWAQGRDGLTASRAADALNAPVAVTPLSSSVGGIVLLAKTATAEACLRDLGASYGYAAVVGGMPSRLEEEEEGARQSSSRPRTRLERLRFLETSAAASLDDSHLSLITFSAAADVSAAELCEQLDTLGLCVVGASQARGRFQARGLPVPSVGGPHIALVRVQLPAALECIRPAGALSCVEVAPPSKFRKTMRRERLHAERRAAAAWGEHTPSPDGVTGGETRVAFMNASFLVGPGELAPRMSSASLVHEAVSAAAAAAAPPSSTGSAADEPAGAVGGASPQAPVRVLDLGCGCGALVVSALLCLGPRAVGVGLDIEASALAWARRNADDLGVSDRLELVCADFGQLHTRRVREELPEEGFNAILCNPPYLGARAKRGRTTGEEDRALYAGADGLRAYESIARSLALARPPLLSPRGILVMQLPGACGERRRARIASIFTEQGFTPRMADPCERGIVRCLLISNGRRKVEAEAERSGGG